MSESPPPGWLSLSATAARLGLSHQRVHVLARAGRLPAVRIGWEWYIAPDAVVAPPPSPTRFRRSSVPAMEIADTPPGSSVRETARRLGVGTTTVRNWMRHGALPVTIWQQEHRLPSDLERPAMPRRRRPSAADVEVALTTVRLARWFRRYGWWSAEFRNRDGEGLIVAVAHGQDAPEPDEAAAFAALRRTLALERGAGYDARHWLGL